VHWYDDVNPSVWSKARDVFRSDRAAGPSLLFPSSSTYPVASAVSGGQSPDCTSLPLCSNMSSISFLDLICSMIADTSDVLPRLSCPYSSTKLAWPSCSYLCSDLSAASLHMPGLELYTHCATLLRHGPRMGVASSHWI
jgi:hypothetical protein